MSAEEAETQAIYIQLKAVRPDAQSPYFSSRDFFFFLKKEREIENALRFRQVLV